MGITERVEQMTVRVQAPSRSVSAQIRGRHDVSVSFAPGFYHRADEHEMETQLAQVGKLLWAARTREYNRIISDEHQQTIEDSRPTSQRDFEFYDKRENLVAEGASADDRVRLSVRGMRDWTVAVAPGALRQLPEEEFAAQVAVAARELIADQVAKIRELKVAIYDPEFLAQFKE
jgi:hypothetical protein